jgi:hypothetical protein
MTLPIQHDRLAQLLMKGDPSIGFDAARIRLERAALTLSAGAAARTPWGQAALLTIAECAVRSFRGGVYLCGEFADPVCVGNYMPVPLRRMLLAAGCRIEDPPAHAVTLHVGSDSAPIGTKIQGWTDGWLALVGPPTVQETRPGNELSGALAGAMLVTEAFRFTGLGDLAAGRRTQRLSPLTPDNPTPDGITLTLLPAAAWVVGLGNLGQALLWALGLLPYADPGNVHLVLQDMDISGPENRDTQILTTSQWIGGKKARNAAHWAEERGFRTTINELPFCMETIRQADHAGLAFVGVDNLQARRSVARADAGFDLVLDAGLGATAPEVFDIRLHGFPGFRNVDEAWPVIAAEAQPTQLRPDLQKLVSQGRLDPCGALTIGEIAVGVPSTAVAAAVIQIAQACRAILTRRVCDFVDLSLVNPARAQTHETEFVRAGHLLFEEVKRRSLF